MQGHRAVTLLALLGTTALAPTMASAQLACTDLLTNPPLAGNPAVFSATAAVQTTGGRSYCMVNVTWRDPALVGSAAGYAPGGPPTVDTFQTIRLGVALPLNTNTGNAAWGGRLIMTAGGGAQGSVPGLTGMITMNPAAIGAGSDSGHGDSNSGSGNSWGVVQSTHTLNYGKLQDWAGGRSNGITVKLAKQLAQVYYGTPVQKTYWNGCSGGGHMGWAQVENYPEEYDGYLIGAPAMYWQEFRQVDSWAALNIKKLSQQTGWALPITSGQLAAANAAAHAACAGNSIPDAFYADPRACTFSASNNICFRPNAPNPPNCVKTQAQADTIDRIWDGPRNSFGRRIWQPYVRGISIGTGTATAGSTTQVMQYNHQDNTFDPRNLYLDQESINLAGNPPNAITYENEAQLGANVADDYIDEVNPGIQGAYNRGSKIMVYHGTQDPLILFNHDIDRYRRVATYFGGGVANLDALRQWYRLYLVPGAPHCPAVPNALPALINWVENGVPPDSLAQTLAATGAAPLLCPFPQTAIYNGAGSTTDAANFSCGGNLETVQAVCATVRTVYKHETENAFDYSGVGVQASMCAGQPGH
jgi:Tannase and feruloyl esterase